MRFTPKPASEAGKKSAAGKLTPANVQEALGPLETVENAYHPISPIAWWAGPFGGKGVESRASERRDRVTEWTEPQGGKGTRTYPTSYSLLYFYSLGHMVTYRKRP